MTTNVYDREDQLYLITTKTKNIIEHKLRGIRCDIRGK